MNQPINHGILESDLNLNGYGFVNIEGVLGTFQPRSSVLDELADTSPSYVGIQLLQFAAPGVDSLLGIHSNGVPYYAAGSGYVPTSRAVNTQSPLDGGGALTGDLTLSISAAGQFNDGYLSAADWNTFSGKQAALGFTPEPALGNPGTSGFVLSSTMGGVRSWVASPLAVDVTASNWIRSYNPTTGAFTSSRPVVADLSNANILALLASPAFTGTPTAPTASGGTNTTQIATTAFVTSAVAAGAPFVDSTAIIKGSSDATKLLRFEVDGFTTGTTRVLTPPNFDGTIATLAGTETFTNKTITGATAVSVRSSGVGNLAFASGESLAADRQLLISVGASTRSLTILGDIEFDSNFVVSNDIALASDGVGSRTLNIGAGGTLGSNAFTSTSYQPLDADLTTIAGLTATTDNFLVSVASAWASRTPSQVRTTLGLVIGTNVQAYDADLTTWSGITPGTGVGTALAVNVGSAGAILVNGGVLGTPSSGTLTNATGLPIGGINFLDTDGTLAANSDAKVPSQKAVKTYVDANAGPGYLVYAALLTQSGNSAPVATILANTLGGTVVWTYEGTGSYTGTLSGAFTANKVPSFSFITIASGGAPPAYDDAIWILGNRTDNNSFALRSFTTGGGLGDYLLNSTFIEIRVYP